MQNLSARPEAPTASVLIWRYFCLVGNQSIDQAEIIRCVARRRREDVRSKWCGGGDLWPNYWSALRDFAREQSGPRTGRFFRSSSVRRLELDGFSGIDRALQITGSKATSWIPA